MGEDGVNVKLGVCEPVITEKGCFTFKGQHFWRGGSMHTTNLMHTGPV